MLLERLHKLTGWEIRNAYEEEDSFAGYFFVKDGEATDQQWEREPACEACDSLIESGELAPEDGLCDYCRWREENGG